MNVHFTPTQATLEKIHKIVTMRESIVNGKQPTWKQIAHKFNNSRFWIETLYRWHQINEKPVQSPPDEW